MISRSALVASRREGKEEGTEHLEEEPRRESETFIRSGKNSKNERIKIGEIK